MHILDLEDRVEMLVAENRYLQGAKIRAEESLQNVVYQKDVELSGIEQGFRALDMEDDRLRQMDQGLTSNINVRNDTLHAGDAHVHQQSQELEQLKLQHKELISGMEDIIRGKITLATADCDAENERLRGELHAATEQIKTPQRQILMDNPADSPLMVRDEDYFNSACQQLYQHVHQWVLRFSEVSITKGCWLSSEIYNEKITDRLDIVILDGSDVDIHLNDRVKRQDVFMSVVMAMIWEHVFTRYLFGMDRAQRLELKGLENILHEVGE